VQRDLASKESSRDADATATAESRRRRQLDQAIALPTPDLSQHPVRHPSQVSTIEHKTNDARTPAGGMPLQRDRDEAIAGKESRRSPAAESALTEARQVGLIPRQPQAMQRQALTVGFKLRASPVRHRSAASLVLVKCPYRRDEKFPLQGLGGPEDQPRSNLIRLVAIRFLSTEAQNAASHIAAAGTA
jgi:hypothetical protein